MRNSAGDFTRRNHRESQEHRDNGSRLRPSPAVVESSRLFRQRDAKHLNDLEQELERAAIMKAGEISSDVVTMNSRVKVKDLNSGRVMTYQIVFPGEADIAKNRISVLAPIGTGLLGYSAGTTIE